MRAELDGARRSPSNHTKVSTNNHSDPSQQVSSANKATISSVLNGSSLNGKAISNGSSSPHANGTGISNGTARSPTFFGHDRKEITRIIIQGLSDLGYASSAEALSRESGYELETPYASAFRIAILQGEWAEAELLLLGDLPGESSENEDNTQSHTPAKAAGDMNGSTVGIARSPAKEKEFAGLALSANADRNEMLFLIRQQKYLELLELRDLGAALMVLRQELQPLHQDERQLHALSSLIMCQSTDDLRSQAAWDGAHGASRHDLLSTLSRSISPSAMIPEHRMAELFHYVKRSQVDNCLYHNQKEWPSLYMDHVCERDDFPLETVVELSKQTDEIYFIAFSNDGTKLATASRDKTVVIYETNTWTWLHTLEHTEKVVYLAWSPDDTKLITCTLEAQLWDTRLGTSLRVINVTGESPVTSEPISSAAWAPDGQSFVTGGFQPKRSLCVWPTDAGPDVIPLHNFSAECSRIRSCAISTIGVPSSSLAAAESYPGNPASRSALGPQRLVALGVDHTITIFDYVRRVKLQAISIDVASCLTSISITRDGQEILVGLNPSEIWSMSMENGEVQHKYVGHQQEEYVIQSCYGGAREGFIISGSEDSRIHIWHRQSGQLLEQLEAHTSGPVNAVAWNMAKPEMLASGGDDAKVRIWARPAQRRRVSGTATIIEQNLLSSEDEDSDQGGQGGSKNGPPQWGNHRARSTEHVLASSSNVSIRRGLGARNATDAGSSGASLSGDTGTGLGSEGSPALMHR